MKFKILLSVLLIGSLCGFAHAEEPASLIERFENPPVGARPLVRWWWLDRQSKESITRDLEGLKEQGCGGMILYACGGNMLPEEVFGPREMYWTPEWLEMVKHAAAEADRLGLDLFINQVATSSGSGGPWISPEESGKKLVWSAHIVKGGGHVTVQLPPPEILEDYYRDVAVVAYQSDAKPWQPMQADSVSLSASSTEFESTSVDLVLDGNLKNYWSSHENDQDGEYIDLEFEKPFAAAALYLVPRPHFGPKVIRVQISDDGTTYREVDRISVPRMIPSTTIFKPVESRFIRLRFAEGYHPKNRIGIRELRLISSGNPAVDIPPFEHFDQQVAKARVSGEGRDAMLQAGNRKNHSIKPEVAAESVIDLTKWVNEDGILNWEAPEGNWMIFRFGQTSIGHHMHVNTATGLHVDYLNPDSLRKHFMEGVDTHLLNGLSPELEAAFSGIYEDSFELPFNTWTEAFADEFEKRRGYVITPWLPVLAGRVVNSKAESERFLWDYRRTIADLYITHWETARELCNKRGFPFMSQAAGPQTYNFDALSQLGRTDIPMGEFWSGIYRPGVPLNEQHRGCWNNPVCETIKQASSAAHLYGKPVVACESFTGYARPFVTDWFDIKAYGDRALCDGLNRFAIHLFMSQPLEEVNGKPCVVRNHGIDFNRRATWWKYAKEWTGYLSRCSALLQAGEPVADVAYYLGEGAPAFVPAREFIHPSMPDGYDYDGCNTELLLKAKVEDGRIIFPSGSSYALLVLPPNSEAMSYKVLKKLNKLVKDGAVILGPKPTYSPSLYQHEKMDAKVQKLANKMWGLQQRSIGGISYGKGKILWGHSVEDALKIADCKPVCTIDGADSVLFIQRHTDEGDLFFLSQQNNEAASFVASFKTSGPVAPELWDPAAGERKPIAVFEQFIGKVEIPMQLAERGSVFILLKPGTAPVVSDEPKPTVVEPVDLSTGWGLTLEGLGQTLSMDKLISWTELVPEPQRNYSGTGTYRKAFNWAGPVENAELDLGALKNVAEVFLNGQRVGFLWKPPYRLDVSETLVQGQNELEIKVTNLLINRITGDMLLPPAERSLEVFGHIEQYRPGVESGQDTVLPSGLFGPVTIR
jgi:hypothetical protein